MKIIIHHSEKSYNFKFGNEAMMFDCAISNEFDTVFLFFLSKRKGYRKFYLAIASKSFFEFFTTRK